MRFLARIALFTLLTALLYGGLVGALALVEVDGKPLFEGLTRLVLRPVEGGHTRARMANFERRVAEGDTLDVLFVGSSLTYRGIDARVFADAGLDVFALGLSSQTPLNYAPLLGDALDAGLHPRVVAFEAAPDLVQSDGLEALYAYAVNQPLDGRTLRMAAQVRTAPALNLVTALAWYRLRHPYGSEPPLPAEPSEDYVGAGFTARTGTLTPDQARAEAAALPPEHALRSRQVRALAASVERARHAGAKAVFVVPPVHPAFRAARPRLDAQADTLRALARHLEAPYFDLSTLPLDPYADFSDLTHLSGRGVGRYNRALADTLRRVSRSASPFAPR